MIEIRLSQASVSEPAVCPPYWDPLPCSICIQEAQGALGSLCHSVVCCCEENLREDTDVEKPEVGDAG